MTPLKINNTEYKMLSSWDEMNKDEYPRACYVYGQSMTELSQIDFDAARMILLKVITNIPQRLLDGITSAEMIDILPFVDFVFDPPVLTKNPMPEVKVGRTNFLGPEGMMEYSSFKEVVSADTAFTRANETKDVSFLYELFSILYRPIRKDLIEAKKDIKNWNGERREYYNPEITASRIARIKKKVPFHFIVGAFVYYWAFRDLHLVGGFKNIFSEKKTSTVEKVGNDYGWAGTWLHYSGKQFGDFDETGDREWKLVFIEISRQIDAAAEMQAEIENRSKK